MVCNCLTAALLFCLLVSVLSCKASCCRATSACEGLDSSQRPPLHSGEEFRTGLKAPDANGPDVNDVHCRAAAFTKTISLQPMTP